MRVDLLAEARELRSLFGNRGRTKRERETALNWARAAGVEPISVNPGADPPDMVVNSHYHLELVEILPPGRKRSDELIDYERRLTVGGKPEIGIPIKDYNRLENLKPEIDQIIASAIRSKAAKYENKDQAKNWILVVDINLPWTGYFDWTAIRGSLTRELSRRPQTFLAVHLLIPQVTGCHRIEVL
jgi:hypothetical protein